MLNHFICGSFHHQEEEDNDNPLSPSMAPKRSTRRNSFIKRFNKNNKNPYSTRGLEKFSTVLADLEERRQKIYAQKGSKDISFIRFVYSSSNEWKPIVVKLRSEEQEKKISEEAMVKPLMADSKVVEEIKNPQEVSDGTNKKKMVSWRMDLGMWRRSSSYYYLAMALILILLCLLISGRSVGILCSSIWWYVVHTLKGEDSNLRRSMKKKDYVRKLSDKKLNGNGLISSPKNKIMGAMKESSPKQHRYCKTC